MISPDVLERLFELTGGRECLIRGQNRHPYELGLEGRLGQDRLEDVCAVETVDAVRAYDRGLFCKHLVGGTDCAVAR